MNNIKSALYSITVTFAFFIALNYLVQYVGSASKGIESYACSMNYLTDNCISK